MRGTLYVLSNSEKPGDLTLGIYFTEKVKEELDNFWEWKPGNWTASQWAAFLVAAEEVSHFHYVVHHASKGRQVTQLDLELQGEVDKFALSYFSQLQYVPDPKKVFDDVFARVFENFTLRDDLSEEAKTRYREANRIARRWVSSPKAPLVTTASLEDSLERLRDFYFSAATRKLAV
jgi:hypothetical protein